MAVTNGQATVCESLWCRQRLCGRRTHTSTGQTVNLEVARQRNTHTTLSIMAVNEQWWRTKSVLKVAKTKSLFTYISRWWRWWWWSPCEGQSVNIQLAVHVPFYRLPSSHANDDTHPILSFWSLLRFHSHAHPPSVSRSQSQYRWPTSAVANFLMGEKRHE